MEDHHYGQKENLTGPDIFDKPIDRTKSRRQAEQRFREPETDIREKLEQLPPLSKKTKRNIGIAGAVALVLTGVIWAGGSFFVQRKLPKIMWKLFCRETGRVSTKIWSCPRESSLEKNSFWLLPMKGNQWR